MRSFANLLVLFGFCSTVSFAQDAPPVPFVVQERILRKIAASWGVDPDDVEVEWIRQRGLNAFSFSDSISFRLMGSPRTGTYTIVFDGPMPGGVHSAFVRAGVWQDAVVATRMIAPGDTLREDDLAIERRLQWGDPSRWTAQEHYVGWVAQNTIRAGDVVDRHLVASPTLIEVGSSVVVLVERESIRVELRGVAMRDARYGDEVFVKLEGDRGLVRGVVYDHGVVLIREK